MILSEKQKEYINNADHRYNLKIGARRCGKTYLDAFFVIPKRILERKGKKGLNVILGVTNRTIERNVLSLLREIYGSKCIGNINSKNIAILFGEEVHCLGAEKANQVSKLQGTSIKYLYGDEMAKWHPDVFQMIKSSLDMKYSCLDGALNPENKNHWLKKDFIDKIEKDNLDVYVQHYTIFDNPFLEKEFVENLCKEYAGTVYYNRYILGQWANAEGLLFKQIANDKNRYIKEKDNSSSIISIGIDWGGNGSYHSITATKINRNYNKIQVLASRRLKATDTTTKELFKFITDFIIEIIFEYGSIEVIWCDSAEQILINSLKKELDNNNLHINIKGSIKTEIKLRIQTLNILLNLDRLSFLENKCDDLIIAFQTAVQDSKKADEDRWLDDGTSDIDSLDSFNYSVEYWYNNLVRRN